MRLYGQAVVTAALVFTAFAARAAAPPETGLLTARAGGGFWARFAHPVQAGQRVQIRAFRQGENIGVGRIEWAATVAPYEAYIVDVERTPSSRPDSAVTPYMALVGERPAGHPADDEGITPGFYVVAPAGKAIPVDDPLQATLNLLGEREDVRAMLRQMGVDRPGWEFVPYVFDSHRRWKDPVTERLVSRVRDLVCARGGISGTVPGDWFPPDLAKQREPETGNR